MRSQAENIKKKNIELDLTKKVNSLQGSLRKAESEIETSREKL